MKTAEPGVVALDQRLDQVELADEPRGRRQPGQAEHRDRQRPGEQRPLAAEALDRADVVAEGGLALAGDDHREGGEVHERVGGEVEDERVDPRLGGDDQAAQHVPGLRHPGVAEHPLQRVLADRADVADHDRDRRQHRQRDVPVAGLGDQRDVEEADEDGERCRLGRHRHEGGDGGRRPLIDVGCPLVEGGDRDLEGEPGRGQRDPDQHQRIPEHARLADPVRDAGEVGGPGAAVDEGHPVEQGRRAERADDQVLEPRLQRLLAAEVGRAEDVEGDREGLDRDEEGDQVLRLGQQHHPQHRAEQQRVVLARAGLLDRGLAHREQHGRRRRRRRRSARPRGRARRAAARPRRGPRARPTARCTAPRSRPA